MGKLHQKVVLITGATSGIGYETARLFRDEGATVIATGATPNNIATAQVSLGATVEVVNSDSSDLAQIDALMNRIRATHGRIDVLFANAGIAAMGPVESVDEASFDAMFALNVRGLFFTVQRALPLIPEGGAIILTASAAAHSGSAAALVYAASKAAVRSMGRSFAAALLPRGIRVNTLTPGPIETPLMGKSGMPLEVVAERMRKMVPLQRLGQPIEAATAALFLASSDSSFMTGAEIKVTGGLTDI